MFQNLVDNFEENRNDLFKNGFFALESFIQVSIIVNLKQRLLDLDISSAKEQRPYPFIFRDKSGNAVVMNRIELADLFFYDLARDKFILNFGHMLLNKPIIPLSVEYFCKVAGSELITPPHQDQVFYEEHFDDELAITFWIALDDITENNGALEYSVPEGLKLLAHKRSEAPGFSYELEPKSLECLPAFQRAIVPRGGCIVHHAYAVHRAKGNTTSHFRRALALTYRTSSYRAHYGD